MNRDRSRAVARRKAKQNRRGQARSRRRADLERVIDLMGMRESLQALGAEGLRALAESSFPKPRVVPDPERPGDDDLAARARGLQNDLDRVAIPVGGGELGFNDYHRYCLTLHAAFDSLAADPACTRQGLEVAAAIRAFVARHRAPAWSAYEAATRHHLSRLSRIDTAIYSARQEVLTGGRPAVVTTLRRTPAPAIRVEADGIARRAYRCGSPADLETGEPCWVGWDPTLLGRAGGGPLPVYAQGHALRQARARLGIDPEYLIDHLLWDSLDAPALTPAPGGAFLAEFRALGHRLGYIVAEPLGDVVLIRTFLLVTMRGTPEGDELARRLRLRRPDIEYLGLDRLGTLVQTDLAGDPGIADLLRRCGCGGALELARVIGCKDLLEGYATRFLRFLGEGCMRPGCTAPRHPSSPPPTPGRWGGAEARELPEAGSISP